MGAVVAIAVAWFLARGALSVLKALVGSMGVAGSLFLVRGALACPDLLLALVAGLAGAEAFALGHSAAFGDLACPLGLHGACFLEKKGFADGFRDLFRSGLAFALVEFEVFRLVHIRLCFGTVAG